MKTVDQILKSTKNKVMLVVFPHPDDESVMAGGLIQRARKLGWLVKVVCLTCGEKGINHLGKESLAGIRSKEFVAAVKELGVEDAILWNYCDGNLAEERSWIRPLKKLIAEVRPGLVVGYGEDGVTGHKDHLVVSQELRKWEKVNNWKLLKPVMENVPGWMVMKKKERLVGSVLSLRLDVGETIAKWQAVKAHRSQALLQNWWKEIGFWWRVFLEEKYAVVKLR